MLVGRIWYAVSAMGRVLMILMTGQDLRAYIVFVLPCTASQIKSIWSVLLRNFDFEMIDPVPEADYDSMVIGPKPCKVRYTRRVQPLA